MTAADKRLDRQYAAALWWQEFRATNNDSFLPLLGCDSRYLVMMGGGGSGKSAFAGRKVLERATSEAGHRFIICRKVGRTLRQSCWEQLLRQLRTYYPGLREGKLSHGADYQISKSDLTVSLRNGSQLIFVGLDDVEKLKSIYEITDIWVEEASEITEADFNQLDIRMRGRSRWYSQMILSFNPISIAHWLKKRFFDRHDPRATVHRSTYKDNRFLREQDIETLLSFRETDPYYYSVYALGEWGVTGRTVFDAAAIGRQLELDIRPETVGYYRYRLSGDIERGMSVTDIEWVDDPAGMISIYQRPQKGRPYVLGGDTAGEGSDRFAGQLLDNISCRQCAVLHHTMDEDLYTMQMYCLGMDYNEALIGIESNFSSYPNKILELAGYPNLYVREREDTYTGQVSKAYGVQTTEKTRPVMIAGLVKAVREDAQTIIDRATLEEMLSFVRNKNFRAEAEAGTHDDLVMALAIAHYIRPQGVLAVQGGDGAARKARWTEDMYDDYERASEAEKRLLLAEWGDPI